VLGSTAELSQRFLNLRLKDLTYDVLFLNNLAVHLEFIIRNFLGLIIRNLPSRLWGMLVTLKIFNAMKFLKLTGCCFLYRILNLESIESRRFCFFVRCGYFDLATECLSLSVG